MVPIQTPHARPDSTRRVRLVGLLVLTLALTVPTTRAHAQTEGDDLYRVSMIRAAPGHFNELIEALEAGAALGRRAGDAAPFWIRHSQGDQWDFMLIYPMGDFTEYYGAERTRRRAALWGSGAGRQLAERIEAVTSYSEEWYARSAPGDEMTRRFDGMGLFHVEMFAGLPGKRAELLEQRRMENRYYEHLDRQQNVLFVRESGPNWDAMTIGFHESLQTFAAAGARYTTAQQEEAARLAGFDGVGAISPYLRSLLSYHRDTLGTRVR